MRFRCGLVIRTTLDRPTGSLGNIVGAVATGAEDDSVI